ncbi:Epimerase family protein [Acaryochloris thomasi RCC1774]|uniref:Epimerase family protein n=1 Tax=Acaryochloris thomasi RCC1774 TaxID=1764569 RepID=A0A2W1JTZ6_9CYAN|nr:TIGR01777 family oxidoreductase [Acaryochloris thomasi]PZD72067.1 Epimerase family protein [Acaryochloris thomasi RCC1774]
MKLAITGATGFVGQRLVECLQAEGHGVIVLARDVRRAGELFPRSEFPQVEAVAYTPKESGDWQAQISGCDGVVNLAGEPLFGERWTANNKQEIIASRKLGTEKIVEAIAKADAKPSVLINASAIGYYGTSETATFDETSASGDDFLAQVCQSWEAAAQSVKDVGTRLVIVRIGIVLGKGGALERMLPPFQLFGGGPVGTGRQWFSWVHRDDLVSLIIKALTENQMAGVYNATAPQPVRMNEFCSTLGKVINRPSWLPVPGFALELLLGEAAQVILTGQNVQPQNTQASGFRYQYPQVKQALTQILH